MLPRLLAVTVAGLVLLPAGAGAASTACSESGDVCFSAARRGAVTVIEARYAARYLARDTICLTTPAGTVSCRTYRLRKRNGYYAISRRVQRRQAGTYRATLGPRGSGGLQVAFRVG